MKLFSVVVIAVELMSAQAPKVPVKIVGVSHKLILFSGGTLGGWGDSRDGQLGPRSAIPNVSGHATAFIPISVPRPAVDIGTGGRSSYVLLDDGTVVAFGYGTEGQLGCGEPCLAGSETPVPVTGLRDVVSLAARQPARAKN
jgi:alpha-tubulin suppressor-like RCC1 family protein